MTPKGQGRNPKIFEAPYLDNGARYTDGYNGPPMPYAELNGYVTDDVT